MEKNILEPKLDIKTINEILQDTFYFKILLEFKKKLKNVEAKRYLTMFMKYLAITFAYELSICMERCKILDKDAFFKTNMKKRVRDERQWLHQDIANSRKMNNKILQMGINFNDLIYDLNIIVKDEKLLDLNFEDFNEDQDLDFWNSVFYLSEQTLETIFKVFDEIIENDISKLLFKIIDQYQSKNILNKMNNEMNGTRYSYSVFKLFNKFDNLEIIDKIFILYRYRLVSSIIMIDKIFKENELNVSIKPLINLEFNSFLRKYRALIICIIGNDLMKMNSRFSKSILNEIKDNIDKSFFPLNRQQRDNIHYSVITEFSEKELLFLDEMQYKYLNIIYKNFIENINLNIDEDDILMTNFLICCQDKGLTSEEIKLNYESLYLEYYYTKNIDNKNKPFNEMKNDLN